VSSSPDRPNVGTKREEELCNSDLAPGVEPGGTQGEPPSHRTDTDDVRVSIPICTGHGLHSIPLPGNDEALRTFKLRVYNTVGTMAAATRESREMRIKLLHPDTQWMQVWKNLHTAWVSEEIASMWYIVVHDIVPTNERLHFIRLVESDRCRHCGRRDALVHRLTECNEGKAIWLWTRERIAQMLRTDRRRIPADWCLRPHFQF